MGKHTTCALLDDLLIVKLFLAGREQDRLLCENQAEHCPSSMHFYLLVGMQLIMTIIPSWLLYVPDLESQRGNTLRLRKCLWAKMSITLGDMRKMK